MGTNTKPRRSKTCFRLLALALYLVISNPAWAEGITTSVPSSALQTHSYLLQKYNEANKKNSFDIVKYADRLAAVDQAIGGRTYFFSLRRAAFANEKWRHFQDAISYYEKAYKVFNDDLALQPGSAGLPPLSIVYGPGDLYERMGNWSKAQALYQRVIALPGWAIHPEDKDVREVLLGCLAHVYVHQGHLKVAEPMLLEALADRKLHPPLSPDKFVDEINRMSRGINSGYSFIRNIWMADDNGQMSAAINIGDPLNRRYYSKLIHDLGTIYASSGNKKGLHQLITVEVPHYDYSDQATRGNYTQELLYAALGAYAVQFNMIGDARKALQKALSLNDQRLTWERQTVADPQRIWSAFTDRDKILGSFLILAARHPEIPGLQHEALDLLISTKAGGTYQLERFRYRIQSSKAPRVHNLERQLDDINRQTLDLWLTPASNPLHLVALDWKSDKIDDELAKRLVDEDKADVSNTNTGNLFPPGLLALKWTPVSRPPVHQIKIVLTGG